jgi:hypothetical protein
MICNACVQSNGSYCELALIAFGHERGELSREHFLGSPRSQMPTGMTGKTLTASFKFRARLHKDGICQWRLVHGGQVVLGYPSPSLAFVFGIPASPHR